MYTLLTVFLLLASSAYISNIVFVGDISEGETGTDTLFNSPSATLVSRIQIEDSLPTLTISPNTFCTLGVALVKSLGFTPTIQLNYGQPLVVPTSTVIASHVWQFTALDYQVQTETPFIYDSLLDPSWTPLHLNQGDKLELLTILNCVGSATIVYGGQITWT